ncbi:MAG: LLM class flavin-dependent oxidoreductase [Nitrospinota bacterium]
MIRLSVLDQSPIRGGGSAAGAIRETIELAQAADRLGYHRYWVAEHHSHSGLAGPSPEIMVGQVAARTKDIRVGSGGVMLSHYSPLKVAENFRVLETLYPGRIDLGIGRAPGSDRLTSQALANGGNPLSVEDFPRKVSDLLGYLGGGLEPGHPFEHIQAMPDGPTAPETWLLGSSDQSAMLAAHFGCPFSFAHFINNIGGPQILNIYRERFRPSSRLTVPEASLGVFVFCSEDEEEARRHAASRGLFFLRNRKGETGGVPSPEEALAYPYTEMERHFVNDTLSRTIAGTPDGVKAQMLALGEEHGGIEEFVVVNQCYDFGFRMKTYELMAEAFELEPRG